MLFSVWTIVGVFPFDAPVTAAGALTVQLNVVPEMFDDSWMLVWVPVQIVSIAGVAVATGRGLMVIVKSSGVPLHPAGDVGVMV